MDKACCYGLLLMVLLVPLAQANDHNHRHFAAQVRFESFTRADGIAGTEIRNVLQDRRGMIWFGSRFSGVNRYDGYEFHTFTHDPRNPMSLAGNPAFSLFEDRQGFIWVSVLGAGLSRYDPQSGHFEHYRHDPNDPHSIWSDSVQFSYEDRLGNFWVASANGLDRLDRETGRFTHYSFDPDLPVPPANQNIKVFYEDSQGGLWLGLRRGGLRRLDPATGKITHSYRHDPSDPHSLADDNVYALLEDHSGTFWVGTWQGLNILDRDTGHFSHIRAQPENPQGLSDRRIFSLLEDSQQTLWIGTGVGLNRYHRESGTFSRYLNDPQNPHSLVHNEVLFLYEDDNQNLWISTLAGLSKLDLRPPRFLRYQAGAPPWGLSSNNVQALAQDATGAIWMAAGETLNRQDPDSGVFSRYSPPAYWPDKLGHIDDILPDPAGFLWLGTKNGLYRFDPERGRFYRFAHHPDSSLGEEIIQMIRDPDGQLWLNVRGAGLKHLNPTTGVVMQHYRHQPDNTNSLSDDYINHLLLTKHNILWIGSEGGLNRLSITDGRMRYYHFHAGGKTGRDPANDIRHIHQDHDGTLWLATTQGLIALNPASGDFKRYTIEDGLPDNQVVWATRDAEGQLWIGTSRGLVKFSLDSQMHLYDVADGLAGLDLSGDMLQTPEGEILFVSTNRGVSRFFPGQLSDNLRKPPLLFTDFQLFNRSIRHYGADSVLPKPIDTLEILRLHHRQSVFTLEFAGLNYRHPHKNRYQYRLEGFDENWSPPSPRRTATYTNLSPGRYTFRVRGANNDGVWNTVGKSLDIIIIPPWWQALWFRVAMVLFCLGIISAGYWWRVKAFHHHNRLLAMQVQERTKALRASEESLREAKERAEAASLAKSAFLANMSHELRTPLNGILGYAQLLQQDQGIQPERREQIRTMERSGNHLLMLIDDVLDIARIEAGQITLVPDELLLADFIHTLVAIIQIRAEQKGLDFQQYLAADLPKVIRADEKRLRQILINLLGNAVKYTDHGSVSLQVQKLSSSSPGAMICLRFTVSDTGRGIPNADQAAIFKPFYQVSTPLAQQMGTGLGLSISKHLARLMNGNIQVQSQPGEGSQFSLELPLEVVSTPSLIPTLKNSATILGYQGPRLSVLVVDDDATNRAVLRDTLSPLGFKVLEATDGEEGLGLAQHHQPALILLDLRMPRMSGTEVLQHLRRISTQADTPVIAISASAYHQHRSALLNAGCQAFLTKPVDLERLLATIAQLLALRWIYTPEDKSLAISDGSSMAKLPPEENLRALREAVLLGDLSEIRQQLSLIERLDDDYQAFLIQAQAFTEHFDLLALETLVTGTSQSTTPL